MRLFHRHLRLLFQVLLFAKLHHYLQIAFLHFLRILRLHHFHQLFRHGDIGHLIQIIAHALAGEGIAQHRIHESQHLVALYGIAALFKIQLRSLIGSLFAAVRAVFGL